MKMPGVLDTLIMVEDLKAASQLFRDLGHGDWTHGMDTLLKKIVPPNGKTIADTRAYEKLDPVGEAVVMDICTRLGMMMVKGFLETRDYGIRDGSGKRDPEVPCGGARQEPRTNA